MNKKRRCKGRKDIAIKIERLTLEEAGAIFGGSASAYGGTSGLPDSYYVCGCVCNPTPPTSPGGTSNGPNINTCSCCCC
jgi:hypothetical protein